MKAVYGGLGHGFVCRSRLDGEKPEEDEIRTKEEGQEQEKDDGDGKDVSAALSLPCMSMCGCKVTAGGCRFLVLLFRSWHPLPAPLVYRY